MAVLREVLTKFGFEVDGSGFAAVQRATISLNQGFDLVSRSVNLVGAAVDQLLTGQIKLADEIQDTAAQVGVGVVALQELRFAAEQGGSSAEGLTTGIKFLGRNIVEAAQGSKELKTAFASIGIDAVTAQTLPLDKLLERAADGFAGIQNPALKTNLAMQLFGRSGSELVPLLSQGAKGIENMRGAFQKLGGGFTAEEVDRLASGKDLLAGLSVIFESIKKIIAVSLFPAFEKLTLAIGGFILANRELIKTGIVGFLETAGNFVMTLVQGLFMLAKAGTAAKGVFLALATVFAFLTAPILTLMILLALLAEDFAGFLQGKDSGIGRAIKALNKWADEMSGAVGAVIRLITGLFETLKEKGLAGVWQAWTDALFTAQDHWLTMIARFIIRARGLFNKLNPFAGEQSSLLTGANLAAAFPGVPSADSLGEVVNKIASVRGELDLLRGGAAFNQGSVSTALATGQKVITFNNAPAVTVNVQATPGASMREEAINIQEHVLKALEPLMQKTQAELTGVQ